MRYLITILSLTFFLNSFGQDKKDVDSSSMSCAFCDTIFFYIKPIFGELRAAYPDNVYCYFSDSTGKKSNIKCKTIKFNKGLKHGKEIKYYYSNSIVLVNPFGKSFKKEPKGLRRKFLAKEVRDYSIEYRGEWRKGLKHGLWYYYDVQGNLVKQELYKKGEKIENK